MLPIHGTAPLTRRRFLQGALTGAVSLHLGHWLPWTSAAAEEGGQVLYNGIRLPRSWPPRFDRLTDEPMACPYLASPPDIIPIDTGRQLFVDDFLVSETTLTRTFHLARYHPGNPVLRPDRPWEKEGSFPTAMPFSDGVWYDPQDRFYRMWYMAGYGRGTAYATSLDGITWEKPNLDVYPGTNLVHRVNRDSATVWLDLEERDPARRYKLILFPYPENAGALQIYFSADGIHWGEMAARSGPCGDRTTVFWNPFRRAWVYGIRGDAPGLGRVRLYHESPDVLAAARWHTGEPAPWVGADRLDPQRPDLKTPCQLYNLDAVAYESILLGLFSIWRGQPADRAKANEVVLGYSRDGFHWHRPDRRAFLSVSKRFGDWNWGNVQSVGGCCLVVGDELRFYMSGRSGVKGTPGSGVSATGLATLRRDGFASMDAGPEGGTLTTRPLTFRGRYCFVNVGAATGELRVEVLDRNGRVISGYSRDACLPVRADGTSHPVRWRRARDLSRLAGQPVRLRFHLRSGALYAFWVSPDVSGASHGYAAAGGPGFTGPTDTVGTPLART